MYEPTLSIPGVTYFEIKPRLIDKTTNIFKSTYKNKNALNVMAKRIFELPLIMFIFSL